MSWISLVAGVVFAVLGIWSSVWAASTVQRPDDGRLVQTVQTQAQTQGQVTRPQDTGGNAPCNGKTGRAHSDARSGAAKPVDRGSKTGNSPTIQDVSGRLTETEDRSGARKQRHKPANNARTTVANPEVQPKPSGAEHRVQVQKGSRQGTRDSAPGAGQ